MLTEITSKDWDLIIRRIHKGRCVPFLGAAVNATNDKFNYAGLPLGGQVAVSLIDAALKLEGITLDELAQVRVHEKLGGSERYRELARSPVLNLARVSLIVEFDASDRPDFMDHLRAILPEAGCHPSPLLQTLAALPFEVIVTTNYDGLMEQALRLRTPPREVKVVVQPVNGFDADAQKMMPGELADFAKRQNALPKLSDRGVILYKIHGSFTDEEGADRSATVIITEEDYIQFLTVIGQKHGGVPAHIKARMQDSTLLFLGYSLEDWDFRTSRWMPFAGRFRPSSTTTRTFDWAGSNSPKQGTPSNGRPWCKGFVLRSPWSSAC